MPRASSNTRTTVVKATVRPVAGQKRSVSVSTWPKLANPTNSFAARTDPSASVRLR